MVKPARGAHVALHAHDWLHDLQLTCIMRPHHFICLSCDQTQWRRDAARCCWVMRAPSSCCTAWWPTPACARTSSTAMALCRAAARRPPRCRLRPRPPRKPLTACWPRMSRSARQGFGCFCSLLISISSIGTNLLLATYEQVGTLGFPLHAFHILVEYERQAASSVPEAAQAALAAAPCARHVQLDVCLDWLSDLWQQPPAAQEESHAHGGASAGSPAQDAARWASTPASPQSAARVEPAAPGAG